MPFAARMGDLTAHGPLTPMTPPGGSRTVIIGGRPAWRAIDDQHVCPLVNGTVPHTGGKVLKGSLTVYIDKRPAVRQFDVVVETGGGPNQISAGCETVVIGG
jgi:uncharacterized Zn-binding protein involved in type VI secretion